MSHDKHTLLLYFYSMYTSHIMSFDKEEDSLTSYPVSFAVNILTIQLNVAGFSTNLENRRSTMRKLQKTRRIMK